MTVSRRVATLTLWLARRHAVRVLAPGRTPKLALAAVAASIAAAIATAALGPSAAAQPFAGALPLHADAHPGTAVVTALLVFAVVAGAYGLAGCLDALRRGWALDVKRLLIASSLAAAALGVLTPIGSADPGSYAAYGRLAATGQDPYATPPSALTGAYATAAETPWRTTTSVYGPVATAEQWVAAKLAGDGPHAPGRAVFILGLINAAAFIVTGLLLQAVAAGRAGRRRAAVLFSLNPLLLLEGVAGAHIDVLLTCFVVGGVALLGRRGVLASFAAGVLGGAAAGVKASAALAGGGFALFTLGDRHAVRRLVALAVGAAAVLVPGYVLAGPHAFDQLGHASGFVSFADPWRIVTHPLEWLMGKDAARAVIRVAAWVAFVVLALLLRRGLPGGHSGRGMPGRPHPARPAAVLVLAWLFTAPYVLPWYAVLPFALLAVLPSSAFDKVLIFWTSVLGIAYLPGRDPHALDVWKSGFAPPLLLCAVIAAAVLCARRRR
jgi:hypothetical protein